MKQYHFVTILVFLILAPFVISAAAESDSRPVKVAKISHAPIEYHISTFGVLAPKIEDLSFQIQGRIDRFLVDEGDAVVSGEVLVQLEVKDAKDQLSKMKVALDQATRKLSRFETLFQDRSVQKSQLEDAQDDFEQVRIAYQQAQLHLQRCYLKAPGDGVILKEFIDSRTSVLPGVPIFAFQNETEAWMTKVDLVDKHAFALREGSTAEIRFAPYSGEVFAGSVTKLAGLANRDNGLFTAEITIQTNDRLLRPGMIAEVDLYQKSLQEYSTIPLDAVTRMRGEKATIFLLKEGDDLVSEKRVSVKSITKSSVAIIEDLGEFEAVVVRGQSGLKHQSRVQIVEPVIN